MIDDDTETVKNELKKTKKSGFLTLFIIPVTSSLLGVIFGKGVFKTEKDKEEELFC